MEGERPGLCLLPQSGLLEPFGRVLLEAWAVGTAVILSSQGMIKDIVTDRSDGLLVPYGDVERWVNAIKELLGNEMLRNRLIDQGKVTCSEKYSSKSQWLLLDEQYKKVLQCV